MARGRMLNTTIATDQRLNSLSIESEYLFLKTIPHLDRDGLIHGKANLLWAKVCPERMDLLPKIDELVGEWVVKSLVMKYDTQEGPVVFFHGFTKNQGGFRYSREAPSIFDPPPGYVRTDGGLHFLTETPDGEPVNVWSDDELSSDDEQTDAEPEPEPLRTYSGPTPDEVPTNIKESKGKEKEDMKPPPSLEDLAQIAKDKFERQQKGLPVYGPQFEVAEWNRQLDHEIRTPIAEAIADVTKRLRLWNTGRDEKLHAELHEAAITAYEMGFKTPDSIRAVKQQWRESWAGKSNGTVGQFLKFLSAVERENTATESGAAFGSNGVLPFEIDSY